MGADAGLALVIAHLDIVVQRTFGIRRAVCFVVSTTSNELGRAGSGRGGDGGLEVARILVPSACFVRGKAVATFGTS